MVHMKRLIGLAAAIAATLAVTAVPANAGVHCNVTPNVHQCQGLSDGGGGGFHLATDFSTFTVISGGNGSGGGGSGGGSGHRCIIISGLTCVGGGSS
jgi:hypothetical protein